MTENYESPTWARWDRDGGAGLKVEWDLLDAMAPIGNGVALPSRFVVIAPLANDLSVFLEVAVVDKRPVVQEVTLRGPQIGSEDLKLPIRGWLEEAAVRMGHVTEAPNTPGISVLRPAVNQDEHGKIERAVTGSSRRRSVTARLLQDFADAYRKGGMAGAMVDMTISESTGYRYLRQAREQGLLPPREGK